LRVVVTGASGLVGTALRASLAQSGHSVVRLVRREPRGPDERAWDPETGRLDPGHLARSDAVVHLAGASIAGPRWTPARKAELRRSRVEATRLVATALAARDGLPRVLVSASGVGLYGDRGEALLTEESPAGEGFLAELASAWEAATSPAERAGVRVVHLRSGIVLARRGGALAAMARIARFGLGGPLGSGRQWWTWISLRDLVAVILRALTDPAMGRPINTVAPEPIRQRDFAHALGRALSRPAWVPAPAVALRVVLGEVADEALLASARAVPRRLTEAGFGFRDADLDATLADLLRAEGPSP
jgi:uncharacterized protein (TIGR01777 family)